MRGLIFLFLTWFAFFSIANVVSVNYTVCLLIKKSFSANLDSVHAFYDTQDDFFEGFVSPSFNLTLLDYDIDDFNNATEAANYAIEHGCLALVVDSTSETTEDIVYVAASSAVLSMVISATTIDLSNNRDFPFSFRVIANDYVQTSCVASFALSFLIDEVLVISSDDAYGEDLSALLVGRLSASGIIIRNAAVLDGSEESQTTALDMVSDSDVRMVVLASSAEVADGLFTRAAERNLTAHGLVWLVSDAYVWYASSLPPYDPERAAMEYTVGLMPEKGSTTYAASDASYEAYTYDGTMALLHAINTTLSLGADPSNVFAMYRNMEAVWFEGRTGEVFFDETGDRQTNNISFLSFSEDAAEIVGKCAGSEYSPLAAIYVGENVELERPNATDVLLSYWKILPSYGTPPSRRSEPLIGKSLDHFGMYLFGGGRVDQMYDDLFFFSWASDSWRTIVSSGPSPSARRAGVLASVRDMVVVYGGVDALGNILSDMFVLDTTSGVWSEAPSGVETPVARRDFASCPGVDGFLIFGGYSPFEENAFFDDLWEYSVTGKKWTHHEPLNSTQSEAQPLALSGMVVSPTWDKVYVFGGTPDYATDSSVVYVFDLLAKTWDRVDNTAPGRSSAAVSYYRNSLHIGLGHVYSSASVRDKTDFFTLDLNTCNNGQCDPWRQMEMRDFSRSGMGYCPVFSGWMYCFGGVVPLDFANDLNRFRLYFDRESNTTHVRGKTETVVPTGDWTHHTAIATANLLSVYHIFLHAGVTRGGVFSRDFMNYDVISRDFDFYSISGENIQPRMYHASAGFGTFFLVFGGRDQYGIIRSELQGFTMFEGGVGAYSIATDPAWWPPAREKHTLVTLNENEMWMFGGADSLTELYDTWKFVVSKQEWHLLHIDRNVTTGRGYHPSATVDTSVPRHNRGGAAVLVGNYVFYLGGEAWTGIPTDSVFAFDLGENTWVQARGSLVKPVSFAVAASVGSRIIVHGGKSYYNVVDSFYYVEVSFDGRVPVLSSPISFEDFSAHRAPTARAYHWGAVLGHSFTIGGGLTGTNSYLEGVVLSDVYDYTLGPVCTVDQVRSGATAGCWLCSEGTHHSPTLSMFNNEGFHLNRTEKVVSSCPACPRAMYTDQAGMYECTRCPPGYSTHSEGSTIVSACHPCQSGDRLVNATGACFSCEDGEICPTGSEAPLTPGTESYLFYKKLMSGESSESQPSTLDDKQDLIDATGELITLICSILSLVVVAMVAVSATSRIGRKLLARVDHFSTVHHHTTKEHVILNTPNIFGSFFFLEYLVFSFLVLFHLGSPMFIMNTNETRTKEPRSMISLGQKDTFEMTTTFSTELQFLSSFSCQCLPEENCEPLNPEDMYDEGWGECHPDVTVSLHDIVGDYTPSCMTHGRLCHLRVRCDRCVFKTTVPSVNVHISHPSAFSDGFVYSLAAESGFPSQKSQVTASVTPETKSLLFRGPTPTVATLHVTQTLYEDHHDGVLETGSLVSVIGAERGSQVNYYDFFHENELSFTFLFSVSTDAVRIRRGVNDTAVTVLSDASGVIFAFTALFAILMRCVEHMFLHAGSVIRLATSQLDRLCLRVRRSVSRVKRNRRLRMMKSGGPSPSTLLDGVERSDQVEG
eukprot:Rmarinus@m.843